MKHEGKGDVQLRQQFKLCELLGLEPAKTTSVTIEWNAGNVNPIVRWEGWTVLSDDQSKRLGELLSEP